MKTDTSEKGLENLIYSSMTGQPAPTGWQGDALQRPPGYGTEHWLPGDTTYYDREHCFDLDQLKKFLQTTQREAAESLDLNQDSPTRRKFLARLQGEISKKGIVQVLRQGLDHGAHHLELFYATPTPGNQESERLHNLNRFSITCQLRYSRDETRRSLDLCLFINGLPIITFELKNSLTKQTVLDAIEQYKRDRDPRERLFELGRCLAHFAVDDHEARFCTHLDGEASWFLPFNKGWNDGAGNPPNPEGIKTDYLWKQILTPAGLTEILESYAQLIEPKDRKTGKRKRKLIFPRYHQLDLVRTLLHRAQKEGIGKRYLIQHSAGSGKSNSIAWLAYQLISLRHDDQNPLFDSIIVITDRRILDQQIRDTVRQFAQVKANVGHAEHSADLRRHIENGTRIIISTVQKFPVILDTIGREHRSRRFAILIDEAHSSQGGRTSAAMSLALSEAGVIDEDETPEDKINRIMEARKLLPNASYFAFTATPKNKTLEIFGDRHEQDGEVIHRPCHSYTMKQAIQEGFILDVLETYTPISSYYRLVKTIEDDPEFDTRKAKKKLRRYVESHDHAIRLKAEIMIDHFHEQVIGRGKIGGEARAMVVTSGIERAIQYYDAFKAYLAERKSPCRAIVAFSGEHEYKGSKMTESKLNGFPSSQIPDRIQEDPYRFLICADKFQTGYDEPLLHTMYVDKVLSGIKAVQTLSRLNRARPKKHDVFVLDFMNDAEAIQLSFAPFYRTTLLSGETDPNKLHDLKNDLDAAEVYDQDQVDTVAERVLEGCERTRLDPILDVCVATYLERLDPDAQIDFKSKAKAFVRTYAFLGSILPYGNAGWEKLSIFLDFLIDKLPAPAEDDLARGILEAIDMDSYRVEKKAAMSIALPDEDAEIGPVPAAAGGKKAEPELERLSSIVDEFNQRWGQGVAWTDKDRVRQLLTVEIPAKVAADTAYQNARQNSDAQNARIEHDRALVRVMTSLIHDHTELFRLFSDNETFKRWLADRSFQQTYA
ncbi:MAG: type I restriction endonuclease subunit R [Thermoanaerobaculia bacterium]|nr:type I restriction endonuclease subunit R [Thermoanaerobaculia bacterium]